MPTFNKSRGFKLKSGNTVPFKQMGSSPVKQGQADATLVAAARHAAMQNVPKDLSAQYDKTAEGVIAAQKGKMEMMKTAAKELPGVIKGIEKAAKKGTAKRKARKADPEFQAAKTKIKETKADAKEAKKSLKEGSEYAQTAWGEEITKKDIRKLKRADLKTQRAEKKLHKQRVDKKAIEDFETSWKEEGKLNPSDIREITGVAKRSKKKKDPSYRKQLKERKAQLELEKLNAPPADETVVTDETE